MDVCESVSDQGDSQIRQGTAQDTRGTVFVVYDDVMDAKEACERLNGYNFQNRYLVGTSIVQAGLGNAAD